MPAPRNDYIFTKKQPWELSCFVIPIRVASSSLSSSVAAACRFSDQLAQCAYMKTWVQTRRRNFQSLPNRLTRCESKPNSGAQSTSSLGFIQIQRVVGKRNLKSKQEKLQPHTQWWYNMNDNDDDDGNRLGFGWNIMSTLTRVAKTKSSEREKQQTSARLFAIAAPKTTTYSDGGWWFQRQRTHGIFKLLETRMLAVVVVVAVKH